MHLLLHQCSKLISHASTFTRRRFVPGLTASGGSRSEWNNVPVVISGIAGRFPKASSVRELTQKLLDGVELTSETTTRWSSGNLPKRFGFLDCLDKFDAAFFGLTPNQVQETDPQIRLLMEVAFEVLIDAGLNPTLFRGSRTAVFCGAYGGETTNYGLLRYNRDSIGYQFTNSQGFMIPARLAFHLDLHGPSAMTSTACSSSMTALQAAFICIQAGECDAAIVTGSTLHPSPIGHEDLRSLEVLAMDGRCKAYDASADGFARSEAAVAVLLQKAECAQRSYAQILSIHSNTDGFKLEGIMHPSQQGQEKLLQEAYEKAGVDPRAVEYLEGHGTGTSDGDFKELHALHGVFCKGRSNESPLLLGSVKSNIGHTEGAAGLSGVAKVIGMIQTGRIHGNMFFTKPHQNVEHLFDGTLKVPNKTADFHGGIVGVSSFGIGGTNSHLVLQPGPLGKLQQSHNLPLLLPISGQSASQVEDSLKEAIENVDNPEYAYLLHRAYYANIPGHSFRGIACTPSIQTEPVIKAERCDVVDRPVWVVFPGLGSQWPGMGRELQNINHFAESIRRSKATLKNLNIDVEHLLSPQNQSIYDDIHHSVVAIAAIQIALWDTMVELGIKTEGIIGHSFGEFISAYADGCLSAEETLLITDARGRAFKDSRKVIGGMASIGMSAEELQTILPSDIDIACYNSEQNVTISGEREAVMSFVERLKKDGKFAVMVSCCGFAAHSRHVVDAAELLQKYLNGIIVGERKRSSRWLSTSIPEQEWNSPEAKFASSKYFDNNVRNPVYFTQAVKKIPSEAVVIELSPKGFFQALLSESAPDAIHIAPMTVKTDDKLLYFFQSVGRMYLSGLDVKMENLYPKVHTPVSSSTPSLSHLVQWDHSKSWNTKILGHPLERGYESVINLQHRSHSFLSGHMLEDKVVLPATSILHNIWIQLAEMFGQNYEHFPVEFINVAFRRATILKDQEETVLFYTINRCTGAFAVENQGETIASGFVKKLPETYQVASVPEVTTTEYLPLKKDEVYTELGLRGYNYSGSFKGIQNMDNEGRWADVEWKGNWTTFLDTVLQASILTSTLRHLELPMDIEKIVINPIAFKAGIARDTSSDALVRVVNLPNQRRILAQGVEFYGVNTAVFPRKATKSRNLAYESYAFCPFFQESTQPWERHYQQMIDLVHENLPGSLNVVHICTHEMSSLASQYDSIEALKPWKKSTISTLKLFGEAENMENNKGDLLGVTTEEMKARLHSYGTPELILLDDSSLVEHLVPILQPSGFIIVNAAKGTPQIGTTELSVISQTILSETTITLLRKKKDDMGNILHVPIDTDDFTWIPVLQEAITKADDKSRIFVTSHGTSGILGLVRCLRLEDGGGNIRCIYDPERQLPLNFQQPDEQLTKILMADLAINVFQGKQLGSYRHLSLPGETSRTTRSTEEAYMTNLIPGNLSSFQWVESPPKVHEEENATMRSYKVACAALNFRDVLLATGTIPLSPEFSFNGPYLGFEFSGYDAEGNRVMGLTNGKAMASSVAADSRFVWPVPENWSLQEAATVPVVYTTVLYAFHSRACIQPGQTVLIHAGSGGIGQAAINVALSHGCSVLTTVGSPEKREFLKKRFPQLEDQAIGCSRDLSFEPQFMELTNGRGVDVVLNSLAGDKLHATLRCVAVGGKFIEIGVFDAYMNTPIGMRPFLKNIDFSGVELYHIINPELGYDKEIGKLLSDGIQSGAVVPLPISLFHKDQTEEAFRYMANGKHRGKLVIQIRDESKEDWQTPLELTDVSRRSYFSRDKAYIIVGGLGGLGLEVANWLWERGARKLVLVSRSGVTNGYQELCIRKWRAAGATVETPKVDLSDKSKAENLIAHVVKSGEIGGIFNAALVLNDKPFSKHTSESFREVVDPKGTVTMNLDEISRRLCPAPEYFICFSSIASGRGSFDQSNYGWANSVVERICEDRVRSGHHGLAIQYGVLGQVGFVSQIMKGKEMASGFEMLGVGGQSVESCLQVLETAMQENQPIVSSNIIANKETLKPQRIDLLSRVGKIFGIEDLNSINGDKKLSELGMDSLIAVELRQTLERECKLVVTKDNLLRMTVADLKSISAGSFSFQRLGKALDEAEGSEVNVPWMLHEKQLVSLSSHPSSRNIFIVHGSDGGSALFKPLARRLQANTYAYQFTGMLKEPSTPELAAYYLDELREVQPEGPYTIMGYSIGAVIAFEMVQQLKMKGEKVDNYIALDGCPSYSRSTAESKRLFMLLNMLSMNILRDLSEDNLAEIASKLTGEAENDAREVLKLVKIPSGFKLDENQATLYAHLMNSASNHVPQGMYDGRVTLLEALEPSTHSTIIPSQDYDIERYCVGMVMRHKVKGSHWTFFNEEHVDDKAEIINKIIECSEAPSK